MKQTCFVCQNVDCLSRGSEKLLNELTQKVAERSLDAEVKPYICFGGCDFGPNIVIHPQKNWYAGVKPEDLPEIVESFGGRTARDAARYYRSNLERNRLLSARYRRILDSYRRPHQGLFRINFPRSLPWFLSRSRNDLASLCLSDSYSALK